MRGALRVACALALLGAGGSLLWGACDGPATPTSPPRCEPNEELDLERSLKEGFRALAEGDRARAAAAFAEVLAGEPGHPEARYGERLATRGDAVIRPRKKAPAVAKGGVVIAGELVPVDVAVNTERWRFEERKRLREVARAHHVDHDERPLPRWFGPRHRADGSEVSATSREAVVEAVDLIVLHDSHTETARESFVVLGETGGSTHFLVDWDGQIYQTLDLALEANHVNISDIDRRSVSIDLVDPVDLSAPPLPPDVGDRTLRPLSEFVVVQGEEIQRWGYTDAQMQSLEALLRALLTVLPRVPPRLPREGGADGAVPRHALGPDASPSGIVGHLHLFPRATDPGPGFDWERLGAALR